MTFSLAQAHLFRLLNGGEAVKILNQRDLGSDRHLLTVAGQWLGQHQIRCFLVARNGGQWLTIEIPGEWVAETARLLQPLLPENTKETHGSSR